MEGFSALIMQLEAVSNCTVCKSAPTLKQYWKRNLIILSVMLGIESKRELIKEPYASQIRDVVRRIATGCLNDEDRRIIKESNEMKSRYHAVWTW